MSPMVLQRVFRGKGGGCLGLGLVFVMMKPGLQNYLFYGASISLNVPCAFWYCEITKIPSVPPIPNDTGIGTIIGDVEVCIGAKQPQ